MAAILWRRFGAEGRTRWKVLASLPAQQLAALNRARKLYRNWLEYAAFRARVRRSIDIKLRSGPVLRIASPAGFRSAMESEEWSLAALAAYCGPLAFEEGGLSLFYRGRRLRFLWGPVREYFVILREQFVDEVYRWLGVSGHEVLDVGGSIGDSAIYFAANGARRILALEPYPSPYQVLQANVVANRLEHVITPLRAGAGRAGSIDLSVGTASIAAGLRPSEGGVSARTYSLTELIANWDWTDAVAKIDCEGGEYPLLLDASEADLRRFRRYQIEYHNGARDLCSKLQLAGFDVWYTAGQRAIDDQSGEVREFGLIRARRLD